MMQRVMRKDVYQLDTQFPDNPSLKKKLILAHAVRLIPMLEGYDEGLGKGHGREMR